MTHRHLIASLAFIGFVPVLASAEPYQPLDECVETALAAANLPTSLPGQIAVTPCPDCKPVLLAVDARTLYFVGADQVDLPTLRRHAGLDGRQTRVCHDPKKNVTRLIVSGALQAAGGSG